MFTRVLVPLDGSHLAEAILAPVTVLAARLGAAVSLLHILERNAPAQVHGDRHLTSPEAACAYLQGVAERLQPHGLQVDWHTHEAAEGDVARSITRHAAEMAADLVALATHGAGGHLITVVPRLANLGGTQAALGRLLPTATRALLEVQEKEAGDYLAEMARKLPGAASVACHVERGDPVETVLRYLEQVDADLCILATHACCRRSYLSSNCLTPLAPITYPTMMSPQRTTSPARAAARPGTLCDRLTSRQQAARARRTPAGRKRPPSSDGRWASAMPG